MNIHGAFKFSQMIRLRYPMDFVNGASMPVSDETLAGLEDYLRVENRAEMILQWIQGTGKAEGGVPLSALLLTRNGHALEEDWHLAAVLREEYPAYAESMRAFGKDSGACYFTGDGHTVCLSVDSEASALSLSLTAGPAGNIGLTAFDDGKRLRICLQTMENGRPRTEEFSSKEGTDLFVLVFNNRTGTLITRKSFRFSNGCYNLQVEPSS